MGVDHPNLDLVTIGRAGVDLYGQQVGARLEDMSSFAKYVGGSPANVAIGVARLGLKSAMITRVGDDHMGRFVVEEFLREGVDISGIRYDPDRLTALVILGIRDQEQFPLIFYRENCADMALNANEVDQSLIESARGTLITGTHLSTESTKRACERAIKYAKDADRKVIFDIDYRPVLWNLTERDRGEERFVLNERVTQEMQSIIGDCDLIVGTEEEVHILGGTENTMDALRRIRDLSDAVIVCKLGAQGCVVFEGVIGKNIDDGLRSQGFPVEVFNVLGAGDAFLSGFLRGWLRDQDLAECCNLANAAGAIVVSRHGCSSASPTWRELEYLIGAQNTKRALRLDKTLEHIHWTATRRSDYQSLKVLAIDHRTQLEDLARKAGCSLEKLSDLKLMAVEAVDRLAEGDRTFGVLIDDRFGMRALEAAADYPYWIGRPIELPGSRPLEFENGGDVGATLREWPKSHVVKCLAFYHPDDPDHICERQQRQLLRLFDACRKTDHELLVEIIASKHGTVDEHTVARAITQLYEIGVYPDWWKLESAKTDATWKNIASAIAYKDPYCRGIVVLGLAAEKEALIDSFEIAARSPMVKGFAIGRTIFNGAAEKWLANKISDAELVDQLSDNFGCLVDAWASAKSRA